MAVEFIFLVKMSTASNIFELDRITSTHYSFFKHHSYVEFLRWFRCDTARAKWRHTAATTRIKLIAGVVAATISSIAHQYKQRDNEADY